MQTSLSIHSNLFSIRKTAEFHGAHVPWEVAGYFEDFRQAESSGGLFDLSHWQVIEISGPDAKDFLNRMSTAEFKKFDSHRISHGAFLTGRGGVVSLGLFQQVDMDRYHFLVPSPQGKVALEHLEKFHFAEKLIVTEVTQDWALLGLWNGPMPEIQGGSDPLKIEPKSWKSFSLEVWQDDMRDRLLWIKLRRSDGESFLKIFRDTGGVLLGYRLFDYYRVKSAIPQAGIEATEKDIILETHFERAVARGKGCYPGQEVVERIYTYGDVNRRLFPVRVKKELDDFPALPIALTVDGKGVGSLVSFCEEPGESHRAIGLAYIHRAYWGRKEPFTTSDPHLEVSLLASGGNV